MPPLALGTRIVVTGPSGQVQSGRPEFDNRVGQALQPGAPAGSYEVIWRVSSDEGHPVSGRLSFAVRAAGSEQSSVEASPAANSQSANPLPPAQQQGRTPQAIRCSGSLLVWSPWQRSPIRCYANRCGGGHRIGGSESENG